MPLSKDKQISVTEYALTKTSKNNPRTKVAVPTVLLSLIKDNLLDDTENSIDISNPMLVTYALLCLLDQDVLDKVRYDLNQMLTDKSLNSSAYTTSVNKRLIKLLNNQAASDAKPNALMNKKLDQIKDNSDTNRRELDAIVNVLAWLISERSGLLYDSMIKDSDGVYSALRNDELGPVINSILQAGNNEHERQNHYNII